MSDPIMDLLPPHERRALKAMMSPEAYEHLRERVKGPEDLAREMQRSARLAELRWEMQCRSEVAEKAREEVDKDMAEQGMEAVFDVQQASPEARRALEEGKYRLQVLTHPTTHRDELVALTEGMVQEQLPVKPSFTDAYLGRLLGKPEDAQSSAKTKGHPQGRGKSR